MKSCRFCRKFREAPCMNTREMEAAVEERGDIQCYWALDALGGGERGMRWASAALWPYINLEMG